MSLLKAMPPLYYLMMMLLLGLIACSNILSNVVKKPNTITANSHLIATTPFLRLETVMHTAMISSIDVDKQERYVVTASFDKTARVWDLSTGELLQILRPPIGEGNEGKLYAVALSPDGTEVAVGGFTGRDYSSDFHIYFFDRASGRLTRHISAIPNTIHYLAYSRDGKYLAAALGGANGIRVYDTTNLQRIARDSSYGADSYRLDFDMNGRLVSSSFDGFVRLYDQQFRLLYNKTVAGGKQPFTVRFSPDANKIAVGFNDSTAVNVLSADDLHLLYAPDARGVDNGNISKVAWSRDGQSLYAGGRSYDSSGMYTLLSWSKAGRGAYKSQALTRNTIMDIQPLSHNRLVYITGDPLWGVLTVGGSKYLEKTAFIVDHRASLLGGLRLNPNASVLAFSRDDKGNNGQTVVFDLNQQGYYSASPASALSSVKTTGKGFNITDWKDNQTPKLNQQPLKLEPNEISRCLAISADEKHFLLGADWSLGYYDSNERLQWRTDTPDVVWAVNLSQDGRFAVAALGDGTIRWYRLSDGKEQLAFFPHADGQRWVLWTPEGFYNASPNAEGLIGYHLNQGDDKEGQFVEVKQLGRLFYRPDLIAQRLNGNEQGYQLALQEIGDVRQVLANGLPPRLTLLSQANNRQNSPDYTVQFTINDQGGGIGNIVYKVNGSVIDGRPAGIGIPGHDPLSRRFPLAAGNNTIEIIANDAKNQVESRPIKTVVYVEQPKLLPITLHVIAIGISDYRDHALQLKYADKDALAMVEELKQSGKGLFDAVQVSPTLLNEQATLANIDAAFTALANKVQPQDVFVLYLAGHGKTLNGDYHFVPWETVVKNDDSLHDNSLDQKHLQTLLAKIPATKTVVLLDTCDAGSFTLPSRGMDQKTAISRLMRATGRALLAATSDDNMALEGYDKHGVFTYALLEGLKKADTNNNSQIEIGELADFVEIKVPEITKEKWGYEQFPMRNLQGMSFPIGMKP